MNPLDLYRECAARVPAYRRFLDDRCGAVPEVRTMEDFTKLPMTSKADYLKHYALEELCLDGTLQGKHVFCRSSGTTQKATWWPQLPEQEKYVADYLWSDLDETCRISEQPIFAIVALGLGSWISGELTSWGLRNLGVQKGNLSLVTPGLNLEEVVEALELFAPKFSKTLIYGYPPFAKTIVELAEKRGIDLAPLHIGFRLVGEGYTETFRDYMNEKLGHAPGTLESILSGYGATDFGSAGKETLLCVALRRLLHERHLTQAVLGTPDMPSVCQYDPSNHLLEEVDGELVVTKYQAVPLVRYRTGDRGRVFPFDEMMGRFAAVGGDPGALLEARGWSRAAMRELPFVLVYGRIDGGVTFCGANVLVTQVREVLETDPLFVERFTGNFRLGKRENEVFEPVLQITLEPREGAAIPEETELVERIKRGLAACSSEIATTLQIQGDKAHVQVELANPGTFGRSHKIRYLDTK